jgi:hypothetical protein
MEANSRARESLKCASAMISDSNGYSSSLYLREARESVIALGYLFYGWEERKKGWYVSFM